MSKRSKRKTRRPYFVGVLVEFSDGGEPISEPLFMGTKAECERVYADPPPFTYSGNRPIASSKLIMQAVPESVLVMLQPKVADEAGKEEVHNAEGSAS